MQWFERIGERLKPRDLHVFLVVAEHKSMAKAAQELGVSRPVVSRAVSELEQILGVALFDRMPRGLLLTRYGEALLRRSFVVFDELRQSVLEIERLKNPDEGELRFATNEVFAAGFVPAVLDELSQQFPKLHFDIGYVTSATLKPYLRDRRGEVVVARMLTPNVDPDISAEPLYSERFHVVATPDSHWHKRRRLSLSALNDDPWILSSFEVSDGSPFVQALRMEGAGLPRTYFVSNSLNLRAGLLATGRFLTLIPGSVLRFGQLWRQLAVPLPIILPNWLPTAIFTLKDRTLSPAAISFIEKTRSVARQLQECATM